MVQAKRAYPNGDADRVPYLKSFLGVLPECHTKKLFPTGESFVVVVAVVSFNELAVWLVADFEALVYQVTTTYDKSCAARIRTVPAINYTAC